MSNETCHVLSNHGLKQHGAVTVVFSQNRQSEEFPTMIQALKFLQGEGWRIVGNWVRLQAPHTEEFRLRRKSE